MIQTFWLLCRCAASINVKKVLFCTWYLDAKLKFKSNYNEITCVHHHYSTSTEENQLSHQKYAHSS